MEDLAKLLEERVKDRDCAVVFVCTCNEFQKQRALCPVCDKEEFNNQKEETRQAKTNPSVSAMRGKKLN